MEGGGIPKIRGLEQGSMETDKLLSLQSCIKLDLFVKREELLAFVLCSRNLYGLGKGRCQSSWVFRDFSFHL